MFSGVASSDINVQGTLFQGIKFWISQKVPQRSRFLNDVKVNGGVVLPLEKNADVKIVDHARKEAPPGSHSYTFIEKSLRNGILEDLDDHRVGPPEGHIRSIGSVVQPAKVTRNKYTEEDDRILWNWVNDNPQKGGGTDGNEIYKQLEKKYPQHPWQSWRDRFIRHLKGTAAPFPLPHNAPPTPPFDATTVTESSKNRATTLDSTEDDYQSFSDEDAEALMLNGHDILNIHQDNITEAWKSWTRDHDKDCVHTAQKWQLFWEERVRPRFLKRMAKQTRRTSPKKTIHANSQVSDSPKRTLAADPSAFPPFGKNKSLMPELSARAVPAVQNLASPNKSTTALPSTLSPKSKSNSHDSINFQSPKKVVEDQNAVSPKNFMVNPLSIAFAPITKDSPLRQAAGSPSYYPESPEMTATAPSIHAKEMDILSSPSLPSNDERHVLRTREKLRQSHHETLKRKHDAVEDDLPSSSPPVGSISPKRRRPSASELPAEIASTPQKARELAFEEPSSPLYIRLELEEDEPSEPSVTTKSTENRLLAQQLSETLSKPDHAVTNTQRIFEDTTPLIDFDIPDPEGDWDYDDFLEQNSSQPESLELPPAEDYRDVDEHEIGESNQPLNFDLPFLEEGWDEQEPKVKEDSGSSDTEIYDPQPSLPDTQAILRSKTPAPDFSIPDPDGGWNQMIASSSPTMPDSPRAESVFSQTELKDQMDAWIDAHAVDGISVEQVESVLKNTSMDTVLADKALRHLAKRAALPTDWRGVWTESDDEDLRSTDARKIQRLQEKHGADCLTARWEFLDFYAEED